MWTKNRPKKTGFYWVSCYEKIDMTFVSLDCEVDKEFGNIDIMGSEVNCYWSDFEDIKTWWWSEPIEPPEWKGE